nr:nucleolar complex protein 2-like protein [Fagopyrum tataricum]
MMFEDTEDNVVTLEDEFSDEEEDQDDSNLDISAFRKEAKEHKKHLETLKEKDPEFYQYMLENDKEILEFSDDDDLDEEEDDDEADMDDSEVQDDEDGDDEDFETEDVVSKKGEKRSKSTITMDMVESWGVAAKEQGKIGAVRSLLKAYRIACHHGDDASNDSSDNLHQISSNVFNKVMPFVLSEMDGIIRKIMKLPTFGGKKETIMELKNTRQWTKYSHLVKSYLGNSFHVLNQMTDTEMISFTLRRLKYSSVFLAAFPTLLRKYIKVAIHFWGTGGGALPVVALLFLRDICIRLGSDCLDECFKGMYKAYVLNCHFVNATKLQHVYFLANCVTELFGVDLPTAYLHGFTFIRQLAMILRDALNTKTKDAFRKVYEWKFINCLELWSRAICVYGSEDDFRPLAYPLTQIIYGVARLVPTARYFPLRLRCVRMLNRIAASTNTFIPVSFLLLDMLEMKELNKPPTGGIGKAVDLHSLLKVSKPVLKTRSFQEACIFSVVEELAEHFAQYSYSVAFLELSLLPTVRLRSFCKNTKVERFRREMKQLIRQIEANSEFINKRRASVTFLPNDPAAASFLEDERKAGASPLSKYVAALRTRAQQRSESLVQSSVTVGTQSSVFGKKAIHSDDDEEESDEDDDDSKGQGATVFNSAWLPPGKQSSDGNSEKEDKKKQNKRKRTDVEETAGDGDEDIIEDLVLSSDDEEGSMSDASEEEEEEAVKTQKTVQTKKQQQGNKRDDFKSRKTNKPQRGSKQRPSRAPPSKKKKFQRKGNKRSRTDR